MNTIPIINESTVMYPAAQVEKLLLDEKSRTAEAFEYYQKLARVVGDLERENVDLRERLYRRSWLARYMQLLHWVRQPKNRRQNNTVPGFGLELTVACLFVTTGLTTWLV